MPTLTKADIERIEANGGASASDSLKLFADWREMQAQVVTLTRELAIAQAISDSYRDAYFSGAPLKKIDIDAIDTVLAAAQKDASHA